MKKIQLRLVTIADPIKLPGLLVKYPVEIDLQQGRYIVDAKSLMGIYALDLLSPIDFIIHSDDDIIIDNIIEDIKDWIVTETSIEEVGDMKVGDKVKILASADKYTNDVKIPDRLKGATDEIMQISKDGKSVLLKGIYSWVWVTDVVKIADAVVGGFKVGDKVKILASAAKYVTGEAIPDRLKGATDEIMQISKDGKSVLLKGIYSWVWATDVEKIADVVVSGFKIGDKVKILASAAKYVTGEAIPDRLKGATDEIMQFSKDGKSVLLKGIYSWVWLTDIVKA